MALTQVLQRAGAMGLPVTELTVGTQVGTVPAGPSGRWVLIPFADGSAVLGGMDRGAFAPYGRYLDDDALLNALGHVFRASVEEITLTAAERAQLADRAWSLALELRERAEQGLCAADVPVGTAMDRIGPDSGNSLFLLDTPFEQRSSPPTELSLPRRGWLLRRPLPEAVRVAPVGPWFGQPGGGILMTLDRPIRYYYDIRVLDAFAVL